MKISVRFTPAMIASENELRQATVVVIDVLRATSTIIAALMAGAREVIPAVAADEAVAITHRLGTDRTILCGEQGSLKIQGFHLGNSPAEYTPQAVHGKTIVLTTTNGARSLIRARQAERAFCGALLNSGALARRLASLHPADLLLLCSGTNGGFSMEDALAAGAIVAELEAILPPEELRLTDSARAARLLFDNLRGDIHGALASTDHGRSLAELGLVDDLRFCSQLNIANAPVPMLVGSSIKVYQEEGHGEKRVARFL
jgi:2-phosphosulfolactate phosphatase